MKILNTSRFSLIFCDKKNSFARNQFYNLQTSQELLQQAQFEFLRQKNGPKTLITADQIHKTDGLIIASLKQALAYKPYSAQADFIITNVPQVALGIATADCLPIVIYDEINKVIANVHAGWRGSAQEIVVRAVEAMCNNFGSKLDQLQFFFGPSGNVCCYEIKEDILPHFEKFPFKDEVIQQRDTRLMLDVAALNRLQLEVLGIKKNACNVAYNACTLCMPSFCSFRRSKNAERQMTVVALIY